MSKIKHIVTILLLVFALAEVYSDNNQVIAVDQNLRLKPLARNVWIHINGSEAPMSSGKSRS